MSFVFGFFLGSFVTMVVVCVGMDLDDPITYQEDYYNDFDDTK